MHDKRTDLDVSRPIARQTARRALAHDEIGAAQARPESAPRRATGSTSGPKGRSPGDLVKNSALQPRHLSIRTRSAPRLQQPTKCMQRTPRIPEPSRLIARQTALGALHHGLSHANQAAPLRAQRSNTAQEGESPDDRVKDTAPQPRHRSIRTRTAPRLQQPQVDMDRTPRTRELSRLTARQHSRRSLARVENRPDSRTSPIRANPHGCREIAHRTAHCRAAFEGVARRLAQNSNTAAAAPSAPQANSTAAASHNNMQPKAHAPRHGRLTARQLRCRGPVRRSTSSSGLSGSMQATAAEAGSRP